MSTEQRKIYAFAADSTSNVRAIIDQNPDLHHGRHTFVSHALAGGRSLAELRAAARHSNVAVTSKYLHVVVDDKPSPRRTVPSTASGQQDGGARPALASENGQASN
jgi:hypothetical protein